MIIRPEKINDADTITDLTIAAFKNVPVSRQTEHFIIHALRKAGALSLSLVAEIDNRIVGHIAFSPVSITDGADGWYGLGPVSVWPNLQKQGIGSALINNGLDELKARGAQGCALVGDSNYYRRFGFKNLPQLIHEGIPPEVFLVLPFTDAAPAGTVTFHAAFKAES